MIERTLEIVGDVVAVSFGGTATSIAAARLDGATLAPAERPPLHGRYAVHTHGRTAQEVADVIAALAEYHAAKSARIYEDEPLLGTQFTVGGETFTWGTITVRERGTDCELYVTVMDASGNQPPRFPLRIVGHTVADLPAQSDVIAMVTATIDATQAEIAAAAQKIADIQALLGG